MSQNLDNIVYGKRKRVMSNEGVLSLVTCQPDFTMKPQRKVYEALIPKKSPNLSIRDKSTEKSKSQQATEDIKINQKKNVNDECQPIQALQKQPQAQSKQPSRPSSICIQIKNNQTDIPVQTQNQSVPQPQKPTIKIPPAQPLLIQIPSFSQQLQKGSKALEQRVKISIKSVKMLLKQHFILNENSDDDTSISSFSIKPKVSKTKKSVFTNNTSIANDQNINKKQRNQRQAKKVKIFNDNFDLSMSDGDIEVVEQWKDKQYSLQINQ